MQKEIMCRRRNVCKEGILLIAVACLCSPGKLQAGACTDGSTLYVMEAFSPNGDGRNDTFVLYGENILTIEFKIFNIKGDLVYETTDVNEALTSGWNGKHEGVLQKPGKYNYLISGWLKNGKQFMLVGEVQLLR